MLVFIKRIIQRMLDFLRRLWQAFFVAAPVWVGAAGYFQKSHVAFIFLLIIASICFVVALIGLYLDYQDARRKQKVAKAEKIHNELVKSFMTRTGEDLDTVIGDDILQAKLRSLRDAKVAKDAVPANTGRSASAQGNKLDYWLAKYMTSGNLAEVPKELQRDVLNARLKAEEQTRKFG